MLDSPLLVPLRGTALVWQWHLAHCGDPDVIRTARQHNIYTVTHILRARLIDRYFLLLLFRKATVSALHDSLAGRHVVRCCSL